LFVHTPGITVYFCIVESPRPNQLPSKTTCRLGKNTSLYFKGKETIYL